MILRRRFLVVVALWVGTLLVVAACAPDDGGAEGSADGAAPSGASLDQDDAGADAAPASPAGCDPGRPVPTGQVREQLLVEGVERSYLLDVPEGYDGSEAVPLILNLHGSGSNAEQQVLYSGLVAAAAEVGAVVVSLDGTGTPQGFGLGPASPDVEVVAQLLDLLEDQLCIDTDRVGSTGISNGSATSAILACALDGRLASIAMVAATIGPFECDEGVRVSVVAFHGTADQTVPYEGGDVNSQSGGAVNALGVLPAEEQIRSWADQDGCDAEPLVEDVASDVVRWTFVGCEAATEVVFHRLEGVGHTWPGSPVPFELLEERLGPNTDSIDAARVIVDFIVSHPRRS